MVEQSPEGCCLGRAGRHLAEALCGGKAPRDEAYGGRLDIALHAGDLTGEAQARLGLEPQAPVEQPGRVDEGVAVQPAEPCELGIFQARNAAEDAGLLTVLQLGLEADHVVERAQRVVLTQLDHRVGLAARIGVGQANRLHGPEAQGLTAALRHHLDRQAAFEVGRALPILELGFLRRQQGIDEGLVLRFVERAVDVILAATARPRLVIAGLVPGAGEVDALGVDDGGNGIEEGELLLPGDRQNSLGQSGGGEGAGCQDDAVPLGGRQSGHLFPFDADQRLGLKRCGDRIGEAVPIDRQRPAGRHLVTVAAGHDQRTAAPHFFVQEADGVVERVVRTEGVGADQLGQAAGLMGCCLALRPHFVQHHGHAGTGDLPSSFAAGQAAADHVDGSHILAFLHWVFRVFLRPYSIGTHAVDHKPEWSQEGFC